MMYTGCKYEDYVDSHVKVFMHILKRNKILTKGTNTTFSQVIFNSD